MSNGTRGVPRRGRSRAPSRTPLGPADRASYNQAVLLRGRMRLLARGPAWSIGSPLTLAGRCWVVEISTHGKEVDVTVREMRLPGAVFSGVVTLAAVNGPGYLIAGGSPGYNSAQGGANRFFLISILVLPVGLLGGIALGGRAAGQRKPPADRGGPLKGR